MASFQGKLYAASLYKPAALFRHDEGDRWTSVPVPDGKRVVHLTVYDGLMYAASYDNGNVYRFDGRSWTDLGRVGDNTQTYGFLVHRGRLQVATWPSGKVVHPGFPWVIRAVQRPFTPGGLNCVRRRSLPASSWAL